MSIPIIKERQRVREVSYELEFFNELHELCWGFPSDELGNVLKDQCSDGAWNNYIKVKNDSSKWPYNRIHKNARSYMEPAHALCKCGQEILLIDEYLGACECPHCHSWYNLFGQSVSNPETWPSGDDYDYDY